MELRPVSGLRQRRIRSGPKFPGRPRHQLSRRQAIPPELEEGDSDEGDISSSDEENTAPAAENNPSSEAEEGAIEGAVSVVGALPQEAESDSDAELPGIVNIAESDSGSDSEGEQPQLPASVIVLLPASSAPPLIGAPVIPTAIAKVAIAQPAVSSVLVVAPILSQRPFITLQPAPAQTLSPTPVVSQQPPAFTSDRAVGGFRTVTMVNSVIFFPVAAAPSAAVPVAVVQPAVSSAAANPLLPLLTGQDAVPTPAGREQISPTGGAALPGSTPGPITDGERGTSIGIAFGVTAIIGVLIAIFIIGRRRWIKKRARNASAGASGSTRTGQVPVFETQRGERTDTRVIDNFITALYNENDMQENDGYYKEKMTQDLPPLQAEPPRAPQTAQFRQSMNANYQAYSPGQMYEQGQSQRPVGGPLPPAQRGPDGRYTG